MRKAVLAVAMAIASSAYAQTLPPPDPEIVKSNDARDSELVKAIKDREPTPEELREIKELWYRMKQVQETPVEKQPRPVVSMINLDLSPGSTPPLVRTSSRTGTVLSFMDANGKKWPISLVRNLSPGDLDVEEKPALQDQNSVIIKAKRIGGTGNIAIFLRDFDTPIVITVLAGQQDVDYRADFRVPSIFGPTNTSASASSALDDRLLPAVAGISPTGCSQSRTSHPGVMAWKCKEDQIVRAKGVLLAPATIDRKKVVGQSGMSAWVIPSTPIVSMMMDGIVTNVRIESN